MSYDSPELGGYQFKNPPKPMDVQYEVVQQLNKLADGGLKQRILGYKIEAALSWSTNWIRDDGDLTGIMAVANDTSATLTFRPRPDSKPSLSYTVIWKNKFEFRFHNGNFGVYAGIIKLQSPTTTSTVGDLP